MPVPVSLIERIRAGLPLWKYKVDPEADALMSALDALLSQPTPTAEPDEWCREEKCQYRHWRSGGLGTTHKRGAGCPAPADPPSIADMVPGTTFSANGIRRAYQYIGDDKMIEVDGNGVWWTSKIDPSTIRDVTPPSTESIK